MPSSPLLDPEYHLFELRARQSLRPRKPSYPPLHLLDIPRHPDRRPLVSRRTHPEPQLLVKRHDLAVLAPDANMHPLAVQPLPSSSGFPPRPVHLPQAVNEPLNQPPPPPLALPRLQQVNVHRRPPPAPELRPVPVEHQPRRMEGLLQQRLLVHLARLRVVPGHLGLEAPRPPPRELRRRLEHLGHVARVRRRQLLDVGAPDAVAHRVSLPVVEHVAGRRREQGVLGAEGGYVGLPEDTRTN
ncbi:hypothetical protein CSUB01_08175 [Colletotrichum sublineola]|uniref:Uncharacterized protein n=1 Tax=Colletotrichum sublineola TaxID=1173701 RepID=A0A066XJR4_COLSU|nr:hypothetical protein CSUB01_08175 [Colletotrichum sublineola]